MIDFSENKDLFVQDLFGGADFEYRLPTRVYTEYAWHSLFIQNLLITVKEEEKSDFDPEFIIIDMPSFKANPERHGSRSETIIAVNFDKKIVLIAGTSYAGEIKKSVFTMLNFLLPPKNNLFSKILILFGYPFKVEYALSCADTILGKDFAHNPAFL